MSTRVACLTMIETLAPWAEQWDRLSAGVPFRSWTWLSAWWLRYASTLGRRLSLFVPCVFDDDTLVAALPCYLDESGPQGRIIGLLGGGDVCSEYLGWLCEPSRIEPAAEALAQWLCGAGPVDGGPGRWDLLRLSGFDVHDRATNRLVEHLAGCGCTVHRRSGPSCWRIGLPATWDDFLSRLSKSHRKQVRRAERNLFQPGRAVLHTVRNLDELAPAMERLIDLHQRRRRALGQPGCFAAAQFAAFHRHVVGPLLCEGRLQLHELALDGRTVAADYHLAGSGVIYAYQGGIDPAAATQAPGALITLATLRRAIEQGFRAFDFLRGSEPYKAHWRAEPRPTWEVRIVADRAAARVRHRLWLAGSSINRWWHRENTQKDACP